MRAILRVLGSCVLVGAIVAGVWLAASSGHGSNRTAHLRVATKPSPTTTSAPSAEELTKNMPDCVWVDDTVGDTVGCVLKSQYMPADGNRVIPDGMPGLPVYKQAGGALVGYEVPILGYVPLSVGNDPNTLAHLSECVRQLDSGALDGSPELADCADSLIGYGYPDPAAAAHEIALEVAQRAASTTTPAP